jgi:hypothetical protein
MFLGIFAENRECFFAALLALQLATVGMDLQRSRETQRLLLRRCGFILAIRARISTGFPLRRVGR